MAAEVAPIRAYLGGSWRTFGLIEQRQLAWLQSRIPNVEKSLLIPSEVFRFGQSIEGAPLVLFESYQNANPGKPIKIEDITKWGSILQRQEVASKILNDSMTNGEEEPPEENPDPKAPAG